MDKTYHIKYASIFGSVALDRFLMRHIYMRDGVEDADKKGIVGVLDEQTVKAYRRIGTDIEEISPTPPSP
jgi:hypothetical protein